ncbi:MAG: hypothetical protein A2137_08035 [Chloroflexi bacterium RBG_16_58_8]|nr:MAG: hypothetical protein A2137_08035 [Chloroflexi bacterium RBG_16_58_8]
MLGIIIWLFFSPFFWGSLIVPNLTDAIAPTTGGTNAELIHNAEVQLNVQRFSPNYLFGEATVVLLHPVLLETSYGFVGALASGQAANMVASPLSLGQSLLIVWPHLVSLISLSAVCFGISYVIFMKQEIRAT